MAIDKTPRPRSPDNQEESIPLSPDTLVEVGPEFFEALVGRIEGPNNRLIEIREIFTRRNLIPTELDAMQPRLQELEALATHAHDHGTTDEFLLAFLQVFQQVEEMVRIGEILLRGLPKE